MSFTRDAHTFTRDAHTFTRDAHTFTRDAHTFTRDAHIFDRVYITGSGTSPALIKHITQNKQMYFDRI